MKSFGCMPAVRTPEASRTLTVSCPGILPSPLRDKVGAFHHDRFRGYVAVPSRSGLHPPCLRFAAAVAGHHARLGTRLLVRLCRGRHHRRLNSMRLQGATRTEPDVRHSRIRLPPWMFDGEALIWPGVKDAWPWQPLVREPVDPVPSRAVLLAAPRQRAPPEHHDMVPERCQHRVIGKEACHHLPQPLSLARDRIVHPAPELLLDLPHLGPLTVASGPPKEQEPAAP